MAPDGLSMRLATHPEKGAIVAALTGEAGQPQEKVLDSVALELSARPERLVVLDLSGLGFVSSVGLRTLMTIRHHKVGAGHTLVLANVPERIMGVLRRCKLEGQFATYPTVQAALEAGAGS